MNVEKNIPSWMDVWNEAQRQFLFSERIMKAAKNIMKQHCYDPMTVALAEIEYDKAKEDCNEAMAVQFSLVMDYDWIAAMAV